jgi:hypothetical protein
MAGLNSVGMRAPSYLSLAAPGVDLHIWKILNTRGQGTPKCVTIIPSFKSGARTEEGETRTRPANLTIINGYKGQVLRDTPQSKDRRDDCKLQVQLFNELVHRVVIRGHQRSALMGHR